MELLFVDARSPLHVKLPAAALKQLPKKIGICTTIQHLHRIKEVVKQVPGGVLAGQVLGCRAGNVTRLQDKVDAFLYVGTGEFHPIRVALSAPGKDVFVYNPESKKLSKLDPAIIEVYKKRVMGALNRFYHAKTVGLLVTTKIGQNNGVKCPYSLETKMSLPRKFLARKDKKFYMFAFDTLDHRTLADFPFIDCWVNFACNRIMDDENNKIVNVQDILEAENA